MMQIAVHDRYHNDTHVPKLFSAANYFIVSLLNNSYFYRVEYQIRGTSHLHSIVAAFNDSDPDSEDNSGNPLNLLGYTSDSDRQDTLMRMIQNQ